MTKNDIDNRLFILTVIPEFCSFKQNIRQYYQYKNLLINQLN